jgi:hypothetical protein
VQSFEHLVKKIGVGGLVRRVKSPQEPVAPINDGAGGVNAVIPIKSGIAVALTAALRRGVAEEFPQRN